MSYWLVFVVALLTAGLVTPLARWLSFRWGMVAVPGGRRQHSGIIPKLGGVPLLAGVLAGVTLAYWRLPPVGDDALRLRGVVWGTLIIFVGGLVDDRWNMPPWFNFAVQFGATAVAMTHIVFIEVFTNPLNGEWVWFPRWFALLFTLFWVSGMVNAVNFLDGLDGLAAGVGTVAALLFAWHGRLLGQTTVAAFPLALAGALLGFLPYNFAPARIFLGSGAYILGYQLATLAILSPAKIATALLVLAVPIMDVAWQIVNRLWRGQSPFHGDRGHLHFRLSDGGLPTRQIVWGYYLVAVSFGLVAIFASGLVKLVMLAVLATAVFGLLRWLSRRSPES